MGAIRIGVNIRFKRTEPWPRTWREVYSDSLRYAAAAEKLGFDGVWTPEHHGVASGYNPAPFVALTAIAMSTTRCWIGTQPLLLPLYNPVLVAEQAAVLDVVSGGRLILGVGAGYRTGDFEVLGLDRRERGARTEEGITLLRRLFTADGPVDFEGRHYRCKGAQLHPQPEQPEGPEIVVAARSAAAVRRAARHGLSLNMGLPQAVAMYGPLYAQEAQSAGFDPARLGISLIGAGFLGASEEAARRAVEPFMAWDAQEYRSWEDLPDEAPLAEARKQASKGSTGLHNADQWLAEMMSNIEDVERIGCKADWINLSLWPPGMPLDQALDGLERFATEVLPKLPRTRPETRAA